MLLHQVWLETGFPIAGDSNLNFALFAFQLLSAEPVATLARCLRTVCLLGVAKMGFQFGLQAALDDCFRQLLNQPITAQNFTRITALMEEFV
jgi:hypothetical protein